MEAEPLVFTLSSKFNSPFAMVSILVHGDGFEPPVLAPEEVLRYRQAHSPLCHPCIFNFWRRVQELNPLTPSALTLTGFQDQRLTVRPTLRWRRRRDSNADSLFGIGRLAPCWFNQFTHVSVINSGATGGSLTPQHLFLKQTAIPIRPHSQLETRAL